MTWTRSFLRKPISPRFLEVSEDGADEKDSGQVVRRSRKGPDRTTFPATLCRLGSALWILVISLVGLGGAVDPAVGQETPPPVVGGGSVGARDLANQVNNPAAPLTLFQMRDVLLPDLAGSGGAANAFEIQPVIPVGPFPSFHVTQLVKISIAFPTLPSPVSKSGVGDLQFFDLVTIKEPWGRLGVGPILVFPTASDPVFGSGKWQAGPSLAAIYTAVKNLTAGFVLQNPISYAGSPDRPGVNELIVTPTLTYTLPDGWFGGLSDFNWEFDWKNDGAATIPFGLQVGKVIHLGNLPVSFSAEAGRLVTRPSGTPNPGWFVGFELTPIFKWELE